MKFDGLDTLRTTAAWLLSSVSLLVSGLCAAQSSSTQILVPADMEQVIQISSRADEALITLNTPGGVLASRPSQQRYLQREWFTVGPFDRDTLVTVTVKDQNVQSPLSPAVSIALTSPSQLPEFQAVLSHHVENTPAKIGTKSLDGRREHSSLPEQVQLLDTMYVQVQSGRYREALDSSYLYYQSYENKLVFQCFLLSEYLNQAAINAELNYEVLAAIGRSLSEIDRHTTDFSLHRAGPVFDKRVYHQACLTPLSRAIPEPQQGLGESLLDDAKVLLDVALIGAENSGDILLQARVLYRFWYYFNRLGDSNSAERVIRQALNMLEQVNYASNELVEMTGSAATTLMELGKYIEAMQVLALGNLHTANVQFIHRETLLFSNAFLYRKLGEYEASEQFFFDILDFYTKPIAPTETGTCEQRFIADNTAGQVLTQLGILKNAQQDYVNAQFYLRCAIEIFPQQGVYYRLIAELELARAQWLQTGALDAIEILPRQAQLSRAQMPQQLTAELLKLDAYGSHGDIVSQQASLSRLAKLFGHEAFFSPCEDHDDVCLGAQSNLAYPLKQIDAFRTLIKISHQEASPALLAYYFARASRVLNHVRSEAPLPQAWTEAQYSLVEVYVDALLNKQWMQGTALQATLFSLLEDFYSLQLQQEKRLYGAGGGSDQESARLNQAFRSWMAKERAVLAAAQDETDSARRAAQKARAAFFQHQLPMPVKIAEETPMSLAQIQQHLDSDDRLVRFFIGQQHKFALIVSRTGIQQFSLEQLDPQAWGGLVDNDIHWQSLISPSPANALLPYRELAAQGVKKLILIPDGSLHRLPFSALGTQQEGELYSPLGAQFELIRTYSASSYFARPPDEFNAKDPDIALFAATSLQPLSAPKTDVTPDPDTRIRNWINSLAPIPGVLSEIEHIASLFSGSRLHAAVGNQATRQFLLSEQARSADLLHIATHGLFNADIPEVVGLMAFEEDLSQGAGLLTLSELFSQPFDTDLVVISGCNTMMGRNYKGSGMRSLTRGFMAQGARSVMGTLWSVPDASTSRFMRRFYDNLVAHELDVPQALHATKHYFANHPRFRHPRYWAAFVLTTKNQQYETLPVAPALLAAIAPTQSAEVHEF